MPNIALQRTGHGGHVFSVFHVLRGQPPSLCLGPLGDIRAHTMQPEEFAAEWHAISQLEQTNRWSQLDEAPYDDPEAAWTSILAALKLEFTELQEASLAAGPLETLLSLHGEQFIERVEAEAARDPRFNHLLGGVWQCLMSEEVWGRVQRVRREVW